MRDFTVIGAMCRPMRGEKPIFGPLSKNNTGIAAQREGLRVKNITLFRLQPVRDPRSPPYLA